MTQHLDKAAQAVYELEKSDRIKKLCYKAAIGCAIAGGAAFGIGAVIGIVSAGGPVTWAIAAVAVGVFLLGSAGIVAWAGKSEDKVRSRWQDQESQATKALEDVAKASDHAEEVSELFRNDIRSQVDYINQQHRYFPGLRAALPKAWQTLRDTYREVTAEVAARRAPTESIEAAQERNPAGVIESKD